MVSLQRKAINLWDWYRSSPLAILSRPTAYIKKGLVDGAKNRFRKQAGEERDETMLVRGLLCPPMEVDPHREYRT